MKNIPFGTTVWSQIPVTEHKGETGKAYWRTQQLIISGFAWLNIPPAIWLTIGVQKGTFYYAWKVNSIQSLPMEEHLSSGQAPAIR